MSLRALEIIKLAASSVQWPTARNWSQLIQYVHCHGYQHKLADVGIKSMLLWTEMTADQACRVRGLINLAHMSVNSSIPMIKSNQVIFNVL